MIFDILYGVLLAVGLSVAEMLHRVARPTLPTAVAAYEAGAGASGSDVARLAGAEGPVKNGTTTLLDDPGSGSNRGITAIKKDVDTMTATQHPTDSKGHITTERHGNMVTIGATGATVTETTKSKATRYTLAGLRLALGWVFLWAFIDKMFGLGLATPEKNAWINGGSPTKGFLGNAVSGPFEGVYHSFAGAAWADWLFMIGLAAIGAALILGIGMRVAAAAGSLLLVLMWTAVLPPENNPFMDDHLVYAGVLVLLALTAAGDTLGLGRVWGKLSIVRRLPWLK